MKAWHLCVPCHRRFRQIRKRLRHTLALPQIAERDLADGVGVRQHSFTLSTRGSIDDGIVR
jgi:hypothetical protein